MPIPDEWERPETDHEWQGRPKTYMLEGEFIGLIEAAIRNQQFKSARIWE